MVVGSIPTLGEYIHFAILFFTSHYAASKNTQYHTTTTIHPITFSPCLKSGTNALPNTSCLPIIQPLVLGLIYLYSPWISAYWFTLPRYIHDKWLQTLLHVNIKVYALYLIVLSLQPSDTWYLMYVWYWT